MHLRKLAWVAPFLLAATAAQADVSGLVLEGAVPLVNTDGTATGRRHANRSSPPQGRQPARLAKDGKLTPTSLSQPAATKTPEPEASDAPREAKSLLTLVAALALVGWIQRRRSDD